MIQTMFGSSAAACGASGVLSATPFSREEARACPMHPPTIIIIIAAAREIVNAIEQSRRTLERGGGNVRGESVFLDAKGEMAAGGLEQMGPQGGGDDAIRPDVRAELAEACEKLLDDLPDAQLREIAVMRMDGYLVDEIAVRLEMSKRAIERRLQLIRKTWSEQRESEEDNDGT
jgi:DNA-directed RNA polymerase specialized sigma24 family protein